ncbi:MAG: HAMP domain-containing protein [Ignavibacteria bacterium]|nr:HAMP domain-containing protein [Ignavibacteria bacterium]
MSSIAYKIGIGYFVVVCISILTSLIVLYNFQSLRSTVETGYTARYQGLVAAENLAKSLQRQESAQLTMLQDVDLGGLLLREQRDQFLLWYGKALATANEESERRMLDTLMATYRTYADLSDSLQHIIERGGPKTLVRDFEFIVVRPASERLKELSFRFLELNQNAIVRTNEETQDSASDSAVVIIAASLLNIALSIFAGAYYTRRIVSPVLSVTKRVRQISQGHLNQKIDVQTDDEIGELSAEFNKMTERLRAFEKLNVQKLISEKTKSEAIVASITDPLIVTDAAGRILLLNHAARAIAPLATASGWEGLPAREVVSDPSWSKHLGPDAARAGDAGGDELLHWALGGQTLFFRPLRRDILDDRGQLAGVVTLFQDVTRFKQLEQLKSDFLAAVSHEFRTPLTSINMTIDILQRDVLGGLNERQRDLLTGAKQDCERLKKLVEELLALSKLQSAETRGKQDIVDIARVIEESVRPLLLALNEKSIALRVDVAPDLPAVTGDFQQLCWVLVNLVGNAIRYTPDGGDIRITAARDGEAIFVSVADTGRGIPPEALETIFDKFVQLKQGDDTTPGSVGLGLTIARQVVESHGGAIRAENAPDGGSIFSFTLPLTRE